jgi:hypothetical protein
VQTTRPNFALFPPLFARERCRIAPASLVSGFAAVWHRRLGAWLPKPERSLTVLSGDRPMLLIYPLIKTFYIDPKLHRPIQFRPGDTGLLPGLSGTAVEINATFEIPAVGGASSVGVVLRKGSPSPSPSPSGALVTLQRNDSTVDGGAAGGAPHAGDASPSPVMVGYTPASTSISVNGDAWFAGMRPQPGPPGTVNIRIFLDRSILEVYSGGAASTWRMFLPADADGIDLYCVGGVAKLVRLDAFHMDSMWGPVAPH